MLDLKRRQFITLLGGAAAWPLTARAQQPAMPVVGFLSSRLPQVEAETVNAIQQGLREAGFIEHRNIGLDYRWAEGHHDRLPSLAADLVYCDYHAFGVSSESGKQYDSN